MSFREIVYSEDPTKHTNTLCGQIAGFINVKAGYTYSSQYAFKVLMTDV
jgi:hypothetical protein